MEHDHDHSRYRGFRPAAWRDQSVAVLLTFFFVWLVFDNLALALIFAAFAGGGSELAQRAAKKQPEDPPAT